MNLAELYAKNNSNQYRDAEELMEEYKDQLKWSENENILDIGCGPGNTTAKLIFPNIPDSAHLLGIDVSVEMIKFAEKAYGNNRLGFTALDIGGDYVTDILGNETFDKVFSFYCLHWIPDQRKSVENLWKLMKPNGIALLLLVSYSPLFDLYISLSEQPNWKDYMKDVNNYVSPYQNEKNPSEKYKNLLETVGFNVIRCYEKEVPVKAPNIDTLKKSLQAVNPFIKRIPPNMQNEYMECIMNAIQDNRFIIRQNTGTGSEKIEHIAPNRLIITLCQKRKK